MRPHLSLPILTCLLSVLTSVGSADTTTDLRTVFTFMPLPRYPLEAYERRSDGWRPIEGVAVVRVTLDANGKVATVQVIKSSGNKALDAVSTEALRQWRARPGKAGRFFDIPVNFNRGGSSTSSQSGDGLGITKNSDAGKSASGHR